MIELGKSYRHPRTGRELRVLQNDPDVYEIEVTLPAGILASRGHVHLDFEQTFTVVEGQADAAVNGEVRRLTAGEEIHVPRGAKHVDIWNSGSETLVARNRLWPNPPFIRAYAQTVIACLVDGRIGDNGDLPRLHVAVIQSETAGQSFAAGTPIVLQRALLPLLAALGRRRGYKIER